MWSFIFYTGLTLFSIPYVAMGYDDMNRVWADQRGQFAVLYPPSMAAKVKSVIG